MASIQQLPDADAVAGKFLQQYEVYYKRLDPNQSGRISAMDAATFLKNSGLPDEVLAKVWELSDVHAVGYLDRQGLFVACKLIALKQDNQDVMVCNLLNESPAPDFGTQHTAPGSQVAKKTSGSGSKQLSGGGGIKFLVKPDEKRKYDALFVQLRPESYKLSGDKARQVMMGSKLSMEALGRIWDLADVDGDGSLTLYEFTVAMHLIYRHLQGDPIPDHVPDELKPDRIPQSLSSVVGEELLQASQNALENAGKPRRESSSSHADVDNDEPTPATVSGAGFEAIPWVVNAGDRLRYKTLFRTTDTDKDGFVSGVEIKNVFLQTGLQQNILAHIWNLCDINQEGKLNPEQFALAMWLIARKQAGRDPPAALTPDMIPPSMRVKMEKRMGSIYDNPELESIAKEIQAMLSEKLGVEKTLQDVEYQLAVKMSEVSGLQSELETLGATLKQLTSQRDIAQKRLDTFDEQNAKLETEAQEQEVNLLQQEEEVHGKQRQLDALIEDEKTLLASIQANESELAQLERELGIIDDLTEETSEKREALEGAEEHMNQGLRQFNAVGEDFTSVADIYLEPLRLDLQSSTADSVESHPILPPTFEDKLADMDRIEAKRKEAAAAAAEAEAEAAKKSVVVNNYGFADFDSPRGSLDVGFGKHTYGQSVADVQSFDHSDGPDRWGCQEPDFQNSRTLQLNADFSDDEERVPTPKPDESSHRPSRPPPPRRPPPPSSSGQKAAATPSSDFVADFSNAFNDDSNLFSKRSDFHTVSATCDPWSSGGPIRQQQQPPVRPIKPASLSSSVPSFADDPFKDHVYRYTDAFNVTLDDDTSQADIDPFTAPVDQAFVAVVSNPRSSSRIDVNNNHSVRNIQFRGDANDPWSPKAADVSTLARSSSSDAWAQFDNVPAQSSYRSAGPTKLVLPTRGDRQQKLANSCNAGRNSGLSNLINVNKLSFVANDKTSKSSKKKSKSAAKESVGVATSQAGQIGRMHLNKNSDLALAVAVSRADYSIR